MVNILIIGPNGKMGRAMAREAFHHPKMRIVGGIAPKNRKYIGMDIGLLVGLGRTLNAAVFDTIMPIMKDADVVLDCTRPAVSLAALTACEAQEKPFVTGTTGFSQTENMQIKMAGEHIPVLHAANTSKTVRLMFLLIRMVAEKIGKKADIDITEMHGNTKIDAPSGTGKEIGEMISKVLGVDLNDIAEYGGKGKGPRQPDTIHFSAIRSGNIPSSHQVIFGLQNERLELVHHAYNMNPFAEGMIAAAQFISDKKRGFYTFDDVLSSYT